MNIKDEEQLQQYFERQMSSAQEQNFLINVAARDDMRLAFRSQLELLKAVREDKDASGSPMFARSKTLTALGLGGALVPSSLKEQEVEASIVPTSLLQNIGSAFRRPAISITAGLLAGILSTAFLMPSNVNPSHDASRTSSPVISSPVVPVPEKIISAPVTVEPTKDQPKHTTRASVSHNAQNTDRNHQLPSTPVINNNKPGKVGVDNSIQKPEDAQKK